MFRNRGIIRIACLLLLLALVGCGQAEQVVIPTAFDLNADATNVAGTATANAPTATATSLQPTFPPQATATDIPTETPTETPVPPTGVPEGYSPTGTIYYIYNGNAIAAIKGDGTNEELIAIAGPYSDLTLSPDGTLLAYVAPGSGTAREVYITRRDNPTYVQAISCLRMANVRYLAWQPDGQAIAFMASPTADAPMDIYIANIAGANGCPDGNNQHVLKALASTNAGYLAWEPLGRTLFFSDSATFGLDIASGMVYDLTQPGGFGGDYNLVHSPVTNNLAFLRPYRNIQTGETRGRAYYIDTSILTEKPVEHPAAADYVEQVAWDPTGQWLLTVTRDSISVFNTDLRSQQTFVRGLTIPSEAVFSPNSQRIAYINGSPENPNLPQLYVIARTSGEAQQLTTHQEGTISDLIWAGG